MLFADLSPPAFLGLLLISVIAAGAAGIWLANLISRRGS